MSICSICPGVNVIEISELYFYTCVFSRELEERERESLELEEREERERDREGERISQCIILEVHVLVGH